jgi:hypothetical protein
VTVTRRSTRQLEPPDSGEDLALRSALVAPGRGRNRPALREAVRRYTAAYRDRGVLVEHVIIAIKERARESAPGRHADELPDLVRDVVTWCIDAYYDERG